MKVAYLCHRIPYPPNKGDKIRAFHQLRAIAAQHDIDLFTLVDDPADLAHEAALLQYCRRVKLARIEPRLQKLRSLPYLLTRTPLTLPYFYSAELMSEVRRSVQENEYDRIVVYCSAMFPYVEHARGIPIVTDLVDVDSDKWKQYSIHAKFPLRMVYTREGHRLEQYERKVCEKSSTVIVTTNREAELLRSIYPPANVHTIVNGVDTAYFDTGREGQVNSVPAVVFTGDMSYLPNEEAVVFFAREVLPVIRHTVPGTRFLIVGRNPGPNVRRLRSDPGIEVTGFVPDIRTYLARAQVAVAPFSIAAGIQNKILEAMAFSLPVVATPRAVQGLEADAAEIVETAGTATGLAEKIVPFLLDPELAHRIGAESRRRVGLHYNWATCLAHFMDLLENPKRTSGQAPTHQRSQSA